MSAQAGIWNRDGRLVDGNQVQALHASLHSLGPDGGDKYAEASLSIVYRAFHTTPESLKERQPYVTARGFVLTWDGRLDNREELIDELGRTSCYGWDDASLVAAAYDAWENQSFSKLKGDWAVVVWRPTDQKVVMAVDPMCIRHLFYTAAGQQLWWASDMTPLVLHSGQRFHISDEYIAGFFANDPESHLTPYAEIHQVPAGHFVEVTRTSVDTVRHWNPNTTALKGTDADFEEMLRGLLRQSVRRRLRCQGTVLGELSGGLDSSSIVLIADEITSQQGRTAGIETLSYFDTTEPDGDDLHFLTTVEAHRKKTGIHIDVSRIEDSHLSLRYPDFCSMPGNLGTGTAFTEQYEAALRRGPYRVVLSGIGGDEFMGGVPDPYPRLADLIVQLRYITLAKELVAWSLAKRRPLVHLLWKSLSQLLPISLRSRASKALEPWIAKEFQERHKLRARTVDVKEHFGLLLPSRRVAAADVVRMFNKMAKYNAISPMPCEFRFPFLDQDVIEFFLRAPAEQLLRPGERRSLMRRALKDILPEEILNRRTKQFGARRPILTLGNHLAELERLFESPISSELGFVDGEKLMESFRGAMHGKDIHIVRLLRTVGLEIWLRDLSSRNLLKQPSEDLIPQYAIPNEGCATRFELFQERRTKT